MFASCSARYLQRFIIIFLIIATTVRTITPTAAVDSPHPGRPENRSQQQSGVNVKNGELRTACCEKKSLTTSTVIR